MPYIKKEDRKLARISFEDRNFKGAETPGELNYLITELCIGYLGNHGLSYSTCNDIVGALDSAKMEFYRRVVVPYEDKKIEENGDVYT